MTTRSKSAAVYFTAPDGVEYRVLDCATRGGKVYAANPPAPWGQIRVFRPRAGQWRFYTLAFITLHPEWSRQPTAEMLAIEFERSERGGKTEQLTLAQRADKAAKAPPR